MGIKSTSYVTRGVAESRVQEIINKIINAEWTVLVAIIASSEQLKYKSFYVNSNGSEKLEESGDIELDLGKK